MTPVEAAVLVLKAALQIFVSMRLGCWEFGVEHWIPVQHRTF